MISSDPGATAAPTPRVAVVDADRRIQQSLAEVLRVAGLDVVGTAGEAGAARELIASQRPSVLLVDPRLPDLDAGAALIENVSRDWPQLRIVVMGWADGGESRLPAVDAYVAKSAQAEDFVTATLAACNCA